jgi:AraC family transcriptional regulator
VKPRLSRKRIAEGTANLKEPPATNGAARCRWLAGVAVKVMLYWRTWGFGIAAGERLHPCFSRPICLSTTSIFLRYDRAMAADIVRFPHSHFPTDVFSSARIGAFTLSETRYAPGAWLPRHSHERACIVYVLRGTFAEQYRDRNRAGHAGMAIVRPEDEPHADQFGGTDGRCLNVELASEWLSDARQHAPVLATSAALASHSVATIGRRMAEELALCDAASPLAAESLVLATLVQLARESGFGRRHPPRWLLHARDLLHAQFAVPFTLLQIASTVGVHPVTLAGAFRRHFGSTVFAYVRRLRVEYACRQLAESDASLCEIAAASGFCDQSHFSRVFRGERCMSPSEYRRVMRH